MTDFSKLIPEMRDWNDGAGVDVGTWIAGSGNFQFAVAYSTIFWPRFVKFERYVLREGFSLESLRGFERQCNGDRTAVEAVMNHLHIADLQACGEDVSREQLVYLGKVLREICQAKLAWQFPDLSFHVVFDESEQEDLIDYQITFYQSPDEGGPPPKGTQMNSPG